MVYMYTSTVHYCIHVDSGTGVTMTYVHSYLTVHVRSARLRAARRRARKIVILFSAPANQLPRLGAVRTTTQRSFGTLRYIYPDARALPTYNYSRLKWPRRISSPRRRGGSLRGGSRGRPHDPHEHEGPGAALRAVLATPTQ